MNKEKSESIEFEFNGVKVNSQLIFEMIKNDTIEALQESIYKLYQNIDNLRAVIYELEDDFDYVNLESFKYQKNQFKIVKEILEFEPGEICDRLDDIEQLYEGIINMFARKCPECGSYFIINSKNEKTLCSVCELKESEK